MNPSGWPVLLPAIAGIILATNAHANTKLMNQLIVVVFVRFMLGFGLSANCETDVRVNLGRVEMVVSSLVDGLNLPPCGFRNSLLLSPFVEFLYRLSCSLPKTFAKGLVIAVKLGYTKCSMDEGPITLARSFGTRLVGAPPGAAAAVFFFSEMSTIPPAPGPTWNEA